MMDKIRTLNKLSIIVPVYYNEETLNPLYEDLQEKIFCKLHCAYELIFVDDGSGDNSWNIIQDLAKQDPHIRALRLSRNFGSHLAQFCGLSHATGECAAIKAADMQEPSEMILGMIDSWEKGNNVILALRTAREEKKSQTIFANFYYWMVNRFALKNMPKGGFDMYMIDRKVIHVLQAMDEKNSAITGQILWSGFKTGYVYYTRKEREQGASRWTLQKKLRLVTDTLFSFSTIPITLVIFIGLASFAGSILWGFVELILWSRGLIAVQGWTTLFIFNLFSFGVIMLTLGILGNYLWRTFDATRNRPAYIVEDICDMSDCALHENSIERKE